MANISRPLGPKPGSAVGAVMMMVCQGLHAERDEAAAAATPATKVWENKPQKLAKNLF